MNNIIQKLRNKLIVSCQAGTGSPFDSPEDILKFAKSAVEGGAAGIRSEGIEKTAELIDCLDIPVVGLLKSKFEDGSVKITGSKQEFISLEKIGTHIIAVDGTMRPRENLSGPDFIRKMKTESETLIMADIATFDEGVACAEAGADIISTTLSGYTPDTANRKTAQPDLELLMELSNSIQIPIAAEGRYNTPELARKAIELGAWTVVVGTAITRPAVITSWFADSIRTENAGS